MRQLLAIRDTGSFAKAAQALGMSQPSLSAAIARLEDELKVKLFERTALGSRLTPIGELIAERATRVIAETERIVRDAGLIAGGEAGEVRVGVGTSLRQGFLPRFVRALASGFPSLSICFEVLDRDRLVSLVRTRELDIAVCAAGDEIADEALVFTQVMTCAAVAVAHPEHEIVGAGRIGLDRFSDFTRAGTSIPSYENPFLLQDRSGNHRVSQYRSNDYDPLIELTLAGLSTLIAPAFVVRPYIDTGQLARIDLDFDFRVSYVAIAHIASVYSPIIGRIIRHAEAIGAQLQQSAETEAATRAE
jgi:DNA-binding transcriptional LysR family regulator